MNGEKDTDKRVVNVDTAGEEKCLLTRMDPDTLHFLPFLPSRNRKDRMEMERRWGKHMLKIRSFETLNAYDLITLMFITREYIHKGYVSGYIDIDKAGGKREVAKVSLDVPLIMKEKGVLNKKKNREAFLRSVWRLKNTELIFYQQDEKKYRYTYYIYEFDVDRDIYQIIIYANKRFVDFVLKSGLLVNMGRVLKYDDKEQYAILLDIYMQSTKVRHTRKYKGYPTTDFLDYRARFSLPEIEHALKLDLLNVPSWKKMQVIRDAFNKVHSIGKLPLYIYNKDTKMFEQVKEVRDGKSKESDQGGS